MKITSILLAFLVAASFSFAQEKKEGDKKKADPEAAFAKKDANGDGKLSKEEFTKGAKDAAKSEQQFTARDKDKDGSISKEEFTAPGGKKKKDA
jgi:Ca2+-binding EF-hand superfamily protein